MGVEQIDAVERAAAKFGVEVETSVAETALTQNHHHRRRCGVKIGRELIGIPAQVRVAPVDVEAPESARVRRGQQVVLPGVAGERRVVALDVEHEPIEEIELAQKTKGGRGVEVVLMRRRLHRFRLDEECSGKADALRVFGREVEKRGQLLALSFHVGVQERGISLAASPEDVGGPAEAKGGVEGPPHLRRGVGEHERIGVGRRPVGIARMAEEVCRPPEQRDAGLVLESLRFRDEPVEGLGVGSDVAVVETVVVDTELVEELERGLHGGLRRRHRIRLRSPGSFEARPSEGIRARALEGVPVADGELEVLGHLLSRDHSVPVVEAEGEWIPGVGSLVSDGGFHLGEECLHVVAPFTATVMTRLGLKRKGGR